MRFFAFVLLLPLAATASQPPRVSPKEAQAVLAQATGAALQGDAARAVRLLSPLSTTLAPEDRAFRACMLERFGGGSPAGEASPAVPALTRDVRDAFRRYWRASLLNPAGKEAEERTLLEALRGRLGRPDLAGMDALEPVLAERLRAEGSHALFGRTGPLREFMAWAQQEDRLVRVELPEGAHTTRVVVLDGFHSLGWGDYAVCGRRGAGGWAKPDALYAVRPRYQSLESEEFRVTFLGHETQHFVDLTRFPRLTPWELEYRAKLVELAQLRETRGRVLRKFSEDQGDDVASPHSYANKRVLAALVKRLGLPDEAALHDAEIAALNAAAAAELQEDSSRRLASGQALVETVDLHVPVAPMTVAVAGKTALVHELHITNFRPVEVLLQRVAVVTGQRSQAPIADYRGEALKSRIGRPGLPRDGRPEVLAPGTRAVIYFWLPLEAGAMPSALRHVVEVDLLQKDGPVRAVVEGGPADVAREPPARLGPPLRGGPWVSIFDPALVGGHRTVYYTLDGRARIPGRFAIDWVKVDPSGAVPRQAPADPEGWNGYGSEVLAVADAVVVAARDGMSDALGPGATRSPMTLDAAPGNYVVLDLGAGRFAFYEHLKQGSVRVQAGERVRTGQVIGQLGGSGSSSMGPHLHFHVSDALSPLGAEGHPFVLTGFEQLGAFSSIQALAAGEKWVPAPSPTAHRDARPDAMSVIRFP